MVAIKAHQAARFLADPEPRIAAFLLYGTDPGQVSERAQHLARKISERDDPPGEILRIDDADVDGDRDRLGIELRTLPMFGGRKVVRVTTGRIITAAVLKDLVASDDLAGVLIVEAQNLKPTDTLRATFEKAGNAVAIACYGDEARDLDGLVSEVLEAHGMGIERDARRLLIDRLGADRALSRAEVEKLALFALGRSEITIDDIDEIVGDASELATDRIVNAAVSGDRATAVNELARTIAAGDSAQQVIMAVQRHLQRLHRVRSELDAGGSLDDALRQLRPPIHFKQRDAFAGQCRKWTRGDLDRALAATADALKAARLTSELEEAITERLLLSLASLARR
ncbi:MAG: DNA polymerase III subunit delta [Hyphomicrobiaceae bacterium]|nr:DNA polymerase III subunit delta [Hyphomicrobiaceae bacterium]